EPAARLASAPAQRRAWQAEAETRRGKARVDRPFACVGRKVHSGLRARPPKRHDHPVSRSGARHPEAYTERRSRVVSGCRPWILCSEQGMRRRVLTGLAALTPVRAAFGQSADMRSFRTQVLELMRQKYPQLRAKRGKEASLIEIDSATIDLMNI